VSATVYVSRGRRRRRRAIAVLILVLAGLTSWRAAEALAPAASSEATSGRGWFAVDWPGQGASAVSLGHGHVHVSGSTQPSPIASLAKVMTALVVLRSRSVSAQDPGFTITIGPDDVADSRRRRADGQSVVAVVAGEKLTERQALQALMLPSANNVAMVLARGVSGSVPLFVDEMNATARRLGMTSTRYTDPSGYDPSTVSTAHDQVLLARAAMHIDAFADIVAEPSAVIPEAGLVRNTDRLLGQDGFIGIKTGSDQAAGGCFMFAARSSSGGQLVYGVVLGQRDGPLISAALNAARRLADSVRSAFG
jgi:serine-type D-Ala-D-Ala carboxypeptidase (penicillin-binding protein 5/6)